MEIRRYFELLRRWAWLIILGAVVAAGAAYIISRNTTPVYQATAKLLIDEAPGSVSGNDYAQILLEQRLAQTYVEILTTEPILSETIKRLDLPDTPDRLARRTTVSAPPETQIIVVSVEDTDPQRAADTANMIGVVFTDKNQERENLRYAEPISNWEARIEQIGNDIEALETEIGEMGEPQTAVDQARLSRLETQLKEGQILYTEAFNNLNQLQLDRARESSNVVPIEDAQPPRNPVRPRTQTNTLLALVAGAMLAVGAVFLIEYLDNTVKTQEQILEDTGLSTLGAIAQIRNGDLDDMLITARKPRDPISEAYRVMRTNLNFAAVDGELRSIMLTSPSPGEGKSTTAGNLAVALAQTGRSVIVVDADLRRPTMHKVFGVLNNLGLTTAILDSQTPLARQLQETHVPGVRVMTSGPIPPNPAELLNSQRMSNLIQALAEEADIVVFDTPPVLTVADAAILAPQMDGCMLVVHTGKTRRDTFIQAVEHLEKTNANIFGVVLNRLNPARGGYYYYQYYNTYESSQRSAGGREKRRGRLRDRLPGLSRR